MSVSPSDFKKNDIVLFGQPNGEKTRGQVVKINRKKIKVKTLEARGKRRKRPAGVIWNVPPSLCELLERKGEKVGREVKTPASMPIKKKSRQKRKARRKGCEEMATQMARTVEREMKQACSLKNPPTYIKASRRYLDGHSLTKFNSEHDSQRKKLYRAENFVTVGKKFKTLKKAQKFLDKVLGSAWFQRRFGKVSIRMEMTQGWTKSYCRRTEGLLRMLPEHLNERIILHELTHALVQAPHAGHGRLFCAVYLDLVRHYLGENAYDQLLKGYRKHNVKYSPHRKVKR